MDNSKKIFMNKAIFLDRDGVLNEERGDYTWRKEDFIVRPDVPEALFLLKEADFLLIVITNQGGINKGIYTAIDVLNCHQILQEKCNFLLDALYYSPYYQDFTQSLSRKPDNTRNHSQMLINNLKAFFARRVAFASLDDHTSRTLRLFATELL